MYSRFLKTSLRVRVIGLIALVAIGIGGIYVGINAALDGSNAALNGVDERQRVQLERCEAGNELREGLQEEKEEELHEVQSHGVPYYEEYLGGTEAQLRKLRQDSIKKINERIERYAPEPCKKVTK